MGSKLIVFHKMLTYIGPAMMEFYYDPSQTPEQIEADYQAVKQKASAWAEDARKLGIDATAQVISDPMVSVIDALKKLTDGSPSIVALAASSRPIGTAFLGSFSRQALREAECPIWIMRPDAISITTTEGITVQKEAKKIWN